MNPKCFFCGCPMTTSRENHRFVESGLQNVVLEDVEIERCASCGEESLVLPRMEELLRVLARAVATRPERLKPEEIRLLRKHLDWSGVELAANLGVTKETVSRWENGAKPMSPPAERLLRLCVLARQPVRDPSILRGLGVGKPTKSLIRLRFKDRWALSRSHTV